MANAIEIVRFVVRAVIELNSAGSDFSCALTRVTVEVSFSANDLSIAVFA